MDVIYSAILQIVYFLVGAQVIGRVRFSWKYSVGLTIILIVTAVPLLIYISYISVLYIILVLFFVLYSRSKSVKYSLVSVVGSILLSVVAYALAYLTAAILSAFMTYAVDKDTFLINILLFAYICIVFKVADVVLGRVDKDAIFKGQYLLLIAIVSSVTLCLFYLYIWRGSESGFTDDTLRTNAIVFLAYTGIMAVVLIIIVKSAVKNAKVEAQALQMRQLQEYVGALEALQKDVRVFRHDYVNILSGINGFITNEDMDGLRVYFRTKVIPMNSDMEVNISKLATLHNLEVVELKGLFATKLIRAQELGVNAQVEVYKKIDQINMDSIDLCRAVGILLDNAIEAVMGTEDPTIRVAIIQKKDAIVLVFANNLPEDSPPVHQFFDEGFSTKGENRGLGLSTLKKTLKKYPNVSLDTKVTQLGFVQELEIG